MHLKFSGDKENMSSSFGLKGSIVRYSGLFGVSCSQKAKSIFFFINVS
jgi:hypothetical protein